MWPGYNENGMLMCEEKWLSNIDSKSGWKIVFQPPFYLHFLCFSHFVNQTKYAYLVEIDLV